MPTMSSSSRRRWSLAGTWSVTRSTRWGLSLGSSSIALKVALVISMYMVGLMIGSFGCGVLADKIGRKKTLIASALLSSTASLVGAWMPEYISYTITRFARCWQGREGTLCRVVTAIGAHGIFMMVFTISVETVGNK